MIWNLWESTGYGARRLIWEFFDKKWKRRGIKKFVKKVARNWFTWSYQKLQITHIPQLCGAAWSSRWLTVQLTNGQHTCELVFKPKADILNITLWLPICLMNFTSYTMLDASCVVLRVHYKSMKCDILFSQGSVRTIFRWGGHFFIRE